MQTRREFIKQAALLSGAMGAFHVLPGSLSRALAIAPDPGTSWEDAEHVVILMQENRSFDHMYGALRGVRGFNDPRAMTLQDGLPVWCQTGSKGQTHVPFRCDIHNSNATWTGDLPHDRGSQVAAFNRGRHDRWLAAKDSDGALPMTLGYYDRRDIPFYYALADAFTVCDQHFSSAMTCTTPNRCYLWSGTAQGANDRHPLLRNYDHDDRYHWTAFPERLEEAGVSWRIYQNEVDITSGRFPSEDDHWLGNFGDNPIEYFPRYGVRHAPSYIAQLKKEEPQLAAKVAKADKEKSKDADKLRQKLEQVRRELAAHTPEKFAALTAIQRAVHERAFTTNRGDPDQHKMETLSYADGKAKREVRVPKGDLFHRFRSDVKAGKLPAVSWLVAPQTCSDHPSSAWYGAWYVSEALDILTADPKVWKKTIFILTYDENDGYFDHVPPFTPPKAGDAASGAVSQGIDTSREFDGSHPIGLGFRVPMVIASPWTRGGRVNSQVCDHTSVLQFLEKFAGRKSGKTLVESNITSWRRAVCGDLTSAFVRAGDAGAPVPKAIERDPFVAGIHQAKFRESPKSNRTLTAAECDRLRKDPRDCALLPAQEPGTKPSCALPYELRAAGKLDREARAFTLAFEAGNKRFGARAAGAPFQVHAVDFQGEKLRPSSFTAAAGTSVSGAWKIADFKDGLYRLRAHGPNGFYREFQGGLDDPRLEVALDDQLKDDAPTGNLALRLVHTGGGDALTVEIADHAYGAAKRTQKLAPGQTVTLVLDLKGSSNWYDFRLTVAGAQTFAQRFAGRVETGKMGTSDPAMAGKKG